MRPHPLEEGERVELCLSLDASRQTASDSEQDEEQSPNAHTTPYEEDGWDVRPARVVTTSDHYIAVVTGGWGLAHVAALRGSRAIIRRTDLQGIAEWEGSLAADDDPAVVALIQKVDRHWQEAVLILHLAPGQRQGRLYQRRHNPRLSVRMSPVRLVPVPPDTLSATAFPSLQAMNVSSAFDDLAPVTRLTDVSATGAAIVVDTPLEEGTLVDLEFELPGDPMPFSVRGRVVAPAVALHGDVRPQADGLPGFRRGIAFLAHTTIRDRRRLDDTLHHLFEQAQNQAGRT
jgi:hypothetical protein